MTVERTLGVDQGGRSARVGPATVADGEGPARRASHVRRSRSRMGEGRANGDRAAAGERRPRSVVLDYPGSSWPIVLEGGAGLTRASAWRGGSVQHRPGARRAGSSGRRPPPLPGPGRGRRPRPAVRPPGPPGVRPVGCPGDAFEVRARFERLVPRPGGRRLTRGAPPARPRVQPPSRAAPGDT